MWKGVLDKMWGWVLGSLATVGIVGIAAGAKADEGSEPVEGPPSTGGMAKIHEMAAEAGVPDDIATFLTIIAHRESGGNHNVGLGPNDHPGRPPTMRRSRGKASAQQNEARAARAAYKRLSKKHDFSFDRDRWTFGSAGYFGMLIPYVGAQLGYDVDPWLVVTPAGSFASGVAFLRGLMGFAGFRKHPTFLALYTGWGVPGRMASLAKIEKRRKSMDRRMRALGISPSFADRRPSSRSTIPKGRTVLARLMQGGDVA